MLALAVLVVPGLGGANPGPFRWVDSFKTIEKYSPPNNFNGSADLFDLGFEIQLYGQTFDRVRLGRKGYVTLGYSGVNGPEVVAAPADANPTALNSGSQPGNLLAVWWGDHFCDHTDTTRVRYTTAGAAPDRRFVVEWQCAAKTSNGQQSDVLFQAQLHIFENSGVIQFHYGNIDLVGTADWSSVRVGIKNGDGSLFSNALPECPQAGCQRAHFPREGTVIQYGVWSSSRPGNEADVVATIDPDSVTYGLDTDPTSGKLVAWVKLTGEVLNISEVATKDPVHYRVYFAKTPALYVGTNGELIVRPDRVISHGSILSGYPDPQSVMEITTDDPATPQLELRFEIERDLMPYLGPYVCVQAMVGLGDTGTEMNGSAGKANNFACHDQPLSFGPELSIVSLSKPPAEAKPMDTFEVTIALRNDGAVPATSEPNPILVEFFIIPVEFVEDLLSGDEKTRQVAMNERVWLAKPESKHIVDDLEDPFFLRAGGIFETPIDPGQTQQQAFEVMIPFSGRINTVDWVLGAEVTYRDNSTPIPVYASLPSVAGNKMKMLLSELSLENEEFWFEMPLGCVQGQPTRAKAKVCNEGDGPAVALHMEYAFGANGAAAANWASGFTQSFPAFCGRDVWDELLFKWRLEPDPSLCPNDGDVCVRFRCYQPCDPDDSQVNNGCPDGTRCLRNPYLMEAELANEYACTLYIEPDQCIEVEFVGTIPSETRDFEDDKDPEKGRKPFDDFVKLSPAVIPNVEPAPSLTNEEWLLPDEEEAALTLDCQKPRADLVAEDLKVPLPTLDVIAGTPFNVERRIRNVGPLPASFEYGYYISLVEYVSPLQIPVPVYGSVDDLGHSYIDPKVVWLEDDNWPTNDGIDHRLDLVVVPPGTPPGEYYFGIVLDPNDRLDELSETNNVRALPLKLRVHQPDLVIETKYLPSGTVGVRYNHSLWATGGMGGYKWEKVGGFPAWLELDPETGHLSGIPDEARDYVLTVQVRSGALVTRRTFSLRILAPEGALSIPRHSLPPAFWYSNYGPVELKANGGKPPYTWRARALDGKGSALPPGFCLTPDGVLVSMTPCPDTPGMITNPTPVPPVATPGAYRFLAEVSDQRGATAVEELTIFVTGTKSIQFVEESLPAGTVGEPYGADGRACVRVDGPGEAVYEWSVTGLPRGLTYYTEANAVCITGLPEEFGAFMVNVSATFEGMRASRLYSLVIDNPVIHLLRSHLGTFPQGAGVDERIEVSERAMVTIVQGRLPSGLVLEGDLEGYWIRGTISPSAEPGNYSLLLELRTPTGRVGLAGLGITVARADNSAPAQESDSGCGSSATGSSPASGLGFAVAMLGLLGMIRSRRNRSEEAN